MRSVVKSPKLKCGTRFLAFLLQAFALFAGMHPRSAVGLEADIGESAETVRPLRIGHFVPDGVVSERNGTERTVHSMVEERAAVVIALDKDTCFSPSCPLSQILDVEEYLKQIGYEVLYVFGGTSDEMTHYESYEEVLRSGVFDENYNVLIQLGVVYRDNGEKSPKKADAELSDLRVIPSVFLLDSSGRIQFQFSAHSTAVPLSGEVLLTAARVYKDAIVSESGDL